MSKSLPRQHVLCGAGVFFVPLRYFFISTDTDKPAWIVYPEKKEKFTNSSTSLFNVDAAPTYAASLRNVMMPYNARKAAQTIAFFALLSGGNRISVLKAVKLVYLADRESVRRRGYPIQDEPRVSMPHGPVNSTTYDFLSGAYENPEWSEFLLDRSNHDVGLADRSFDVDDLDELSASEIDILKSIWDKFGAMTKWELRDWTHVKANVPEWNDPEGSSRKISVRDIMDAVGIQRASERSDEYECLETAQNILASL